MRAATAIAIRRTHLQMINFGVTAVARATGSDPELRLDLRCECGKVECLERVALSRARYESLLTARQPLLAPEHGDELVDSRAT